DSKEVAKKFIDVNQNNVRDDVEIEIVEDYGSDRDLVESLFANTRVMQYEIYLAENDLLTEENIQFALDNSYVPIICTEKYYKSSKFYNNKDSFDYNYLTDEFYDTKERKKMYDKYFKKIGGYLIEGQTVNDEICQNFFYESENWIVN
ncbi:hypothetical protein CSB11_02880, partial [Candidatus Campbellbacteria bacterium]